MTLHDSRGIALSTSHRASLEALERATLLNAGYYLDPLATIEAALAREAWTRRAQQLLRFLALVPVEYDRGVSDTRVTLDFEIQEAVAFRTGAAAAFADLRDQLAKRDAARTEAVAAGIDRLIP